MFSTTLTIRRFIGKERTFSRELRYARQLYGRMQKKEVQVDREMHFVRMLDVLDMNPASAVQVAEFDSS